MNARTTPSIDGGPRTEHGTAAVPIAQRVADYDWVATEAALDEQGWAPLPAALAAAECDALVSLYAQEQHFRSRVVMARHGFGRGEYQYFRYPLPQPIAELRVSLYAHLTTVANRWNETLGIETRFPQHHEQFIARCHGAGQDRPTPLLLKYGVDDYNCLHQDLYGEHAFPLQAVFLLSAPNEDFSGGEFVLTEQRPRMQSRAEVVPLTKGDGAVFAVNQRPKRGSRGFYRVTMRHGASRVRSGRRFTAGVIFHDAR